MEFWRAWTAEIISCSRAYLMQKPPVGELRFQAPQEPECWEGVRKAGRFENRAVQDLPDADNPFTGRYAKEFYSDPEFIPEMSEDCLYLNIWVPKREDRELSGFPVAFWIHGGGFGGGYSSEMEFDGAAFCEKGVILVTVEYRVNAFGFLAHPWLTEEMKIMCPETMESSIRSWRCAGCMNISRYSAATRKISRYSDNLREV